MRLPVRLGGRDDAQPLFYGWVIVGVTGIISFVQVAFFNPVLGVFIRPLAHDFGWSRAAISLAISLGTLGAGFSAPLFGPYLDRHGPRLPLTLAVLVSALCLFALAGVRTLWQFDLLFGLGRALSVGVLDICLTVTVAKWFIAGRGQAMSLTLLGQRLGFASLPLLAQILVLRGDWRLAWAVLGALMLGMALLPSLLFLQGRPEDRGLQPDGVPVPTPLAESGAAGIPSRLTEADLTMRQAIRRRAFWLITIATTQALFAQGAVNLHQLAHLQDRGIPPTAAVGTVSVFAIASAIGALFSTRPRRRFGSSRAFGLYMISSPIGLLILIAVHQVWQAYAFAVFYGLSFGGQLTMQSVIYADSFGRTHLGAIRGVALPIQLTGNAAGPVFAGWVYDRTGSYVIAFWIFAGLYALAGLYTLLARDEVSRQ